MNHKLIIGLILLLVVATPIIIASQYEGPPVTITWTAYTDLTRAMLDVAEGKVHILMHVVPAPLVMQLPPAVREKLDLVPCLTSYNDLVFNVLSNVIGVDLPGTVIRWLGDAGISGAVIPGLYITGEIGYRYVTAGNITLLPQGSLHFNPLALEKVRFAFYYLIDRQSIVDAVYGGAAYDRYGAVSKMQYSTGFFEEYIKPVEAKYDFSPYPNYTRARQLVEEAINDVNAFFTNLKDNYGYPEMKVFWGADGWLKFQKPDGSVEDVLLTFIMRTEDQRYQIGLTVAAAIEQHLKIKVDEAPYPRGDCSTAAVYGFPPGYNHIPRGCDFDYGIWHIYTEGWVTTAEGIDADARYDVAYFYFMSGWLYAAPVRHWGIGLWSILSQYPDARQRFLDLVYTTWLPGQLQELYETISEYYEVGVLRAVRVWVIDELSFFVANKDVFIDAPWAGRITGLNNPWAMRSVTVSQPDVKYTLFSAVGQIFMSPWNPTGGFGDIYTEYIHRHLTDYAYWPHWYTGLPWPMRIESFKVERFSPGIPVSALVAYVYDPVADQWVLTKELPWDVIDIIWNDYGGYGFADKSAFLSFGVPTRVTIEFKSVTTPDGRIILGYWHDGSEITMHDIIYGWAFSYEWEFNDEWVTGEADPYFESAWAAGLAGLATVYGIYVVNETTIQFYIDYDDIYDELVMAYVAGWPDIPYSLQLVTEEMVARKVAGPLGPYHWELKAGRTSIDFIGAFQHPQTDDDVKTMAQTLLGEDLTKLPEIRYISTFPYPAGMQLPDPVEDTRARLMRHIEFHDARGHIYISSGPFYIEWFTPGTLTNYMKISRFERYAIVYGLPTINELKIVVPFTLLKTDVYVVFGEPLVITGKIGFTARTFDPDKVAVTIDVYRKADGKYMGRVVNFKIDIRPDGTVVIEIPATEIMRILGTSGSEYDILLTIDSPEAGNILSTTLTANLITSISEAIPATPEPAILPLVLLAIILLALIIIRRK